MHWPVEVPIGFSMKKGTPNLMASISIGPRVPGGKQTKMASIPDQSISFASEHTWLPGY
jgi:hypothetical protein